jgi:uncharacterized membrane protein
MWATMREIGVVAVTALSSPAMDKLLPFGRALFAISLIGLGAEHFVYREFVTGRAPAWPFDESLGVAWAYLSGLVVVLTSSAILLGKHGRVAAVSLSALIIVWALARHIPVVIASDVLAPEWTKAVKALAFAGGALVMAATFPEVRTASDSAFSRLINARRGFVMAGTICLAVFMVNNGSQHFIYEEFVATLVPAWIPGGQMFWTYASAVLLFCGALGMFYPPTASLAALLTALMVFAWVWLVHVPQISASTSANIAVFEAPAIAGIAFVLASLLTRTRRVEPVAAPA